MQFLFWTPTSHDFPRTAVVVFAGPSTLTPFPNVRAFSLPSLSPIPHCSLGQHDYIISVVCMSDFTGSEGLIMEAALCDLHSAVVGVSPVAFSLAQVIRQAETHRLSRFLVLLLARPVVLWCRTNMGGERGRKRAFGLCRGEVDNLPLDSGQVSPTLVP